MKHNIRDMILSVCIVIGVILTSLALWYVILFSVFKLFSITVDVDKVKPVSIIEQIKE